MLHLKIESLVIVRTIIFINKKNAINIFINIQIH